MKIINHTQIPKKKVSRIIDFVMPKDKRIMKYFKDLTIKFIKNDDGLGLSKTSFRNDMITLVYNPDYDYPYSEAEERKDNPLSYRLQMQKTERITGQKFVDNPQGYIDVLYLSATEALVFAAAHECFHLLQWAQAFENEDLDRGLSDKDADMYAIKKQREWRKLHNTPVYQVPIPHR